MGGFVGSVFSQLVLIYWKPLTIEEDAILSPSVLPLVEVEELCITHPTTGHAHCVLALRHRACPFWMAFDVSVSQFAYPEYPQDDESCEYSENTQRDDPTPEESWPVVEQLWLVGLRVVMRTLHESIRLLFCEEWLYIWSRVTERHLQSFPKLGRGFCSLRGRNEYSEYSLPDIYNGRRRGHYRAA